VVFLHFVRWSLGLAPAEGLTSPGEIEMLVSHARGAHRLAEIGVWEGCTTRRLRSAIAPDGELYAVDPFYKGRFGFSTQRIIAQREVSSVANGTIVWLRQTAAEAAADPSISGGRPFDFVFLDALHSYDGLREEWEAWSPLVRPGGAIAVHDSRLMGQTHTSEVGSVRYMTEVVLRDSRFAVVDEVDSLTVLRRL
jgi:predicted O-methyltransferase YrrM